MMAKLIIRLVGALNVLLAIWGLWHFFQVLFEHQLSAFSSEIAESGGQLSISRFYLLFYLSAAIVIPCDHATVYVGFQLIRLRLKVFKLFFVICAVKTMLVAFFVSLAVSRKEPAYLFVLTFFNTDLYLQVLFGFTLWGPILVYHMGEEVKKVEAAKKIRPWQRQRKRKTRR
jgi:hypothetical protein